MQGTQHAYMDRAIQKGIELPPGYLNVQSSTGRGFLAETRIVPKGKIGSIMHLTYEGLADKVERNSTSDRFRTPTRKLPQELMKASIYLTYAGVADKVDRRPLEVVDDSYDLVDLRDREAVMQFDRRSDYNEFLESRPELGLSLEKCVNSEGNTRFAHIMKDRPGGIGIVVDTEYIRNAVNASGQYSFLMQRKDAKSMKKAWGIAKQYFTKDALKKARKDIARKIYVNLVEKGDWNSLKKAMQVAVKYFDSVQSKEASRIIDTHLDTRAVAMADDAISGCLKLETSKEVYNRLVNINKPSTLSKALDIAKLYMNREAVEDTADLLRQHLELKRMDRERDTRIEMKKVQAKQGTKVMESRQLLKPILYMPVKDNQPGRESIEEQARESADAHIERGIDAKLAEDAEKFFRKTITREGRKLLHEFQTAHNNTPVTKKVSVEETRGYMMSTLPPHPDLETFLAPPTMNEIKGRKKVARMESTLPPRPLLEGAAEPRHEQKHFKRAYNRPMNTGEPVTKRIVLTPEMKKVLRAA